MKKGKTAVLQKVIAVVTACCFVVSLIGPSIAMASDAGALLNNPETADPFSVNIPRLREGQFQHMAKVEREIIKRHVRETGQPWMDWDGQPDSNHPRYQQAVKEYAAEWQKHMDKVRALDRVRERGINQIFNRAKELARQDGAEIHWAKDFKPTGTDPWKGRGIYTDMEYTGTDEAIKYIHKALREKNLTVSATPGQNNTRVEKWDFEIWGQEGKGKIHRAFEAENPEFAKSASPLKQNIPYDKQSAAYESLKKAHLDKGPPEPGSWQEYQRMNDLVKAVERGEKNVLGKASSDKSVARLNHIRSMKTDPVSAGLRRLGDENGLQNPEYLAMEKSLNNRLSKIMQAGKKANETFVSNIDKMIKNAESTGDVSLANKLRLYKNQSLQNQILLHKSLYNKLGEHKFAEIMEGAEFEVVRDPKDGTRTLFSNKYLNEPPLSRVEMMERYRNQIKRIEVHMAAGKKVTYRNRATNKIMSGEEVLKQAKRILENLEKGKLAEAVEGTEYEVVKYTGKGGQRMYRNKVTGERISEVKLRKKHLNDPVAEMRKQMTRMDKEPKATFGSGNLSFKSFDKRAFQAFKRLDLPKVKEGVLPPSRAKHIKIVYKYAKEAQKFFKHKYPQLGSEPQGDFWLADPSEALEEYVLEAERTMANHPEILKAFRTAKRGILKQYVRTQIQHQKDAFYMAQEEYIKAAKERSILRARKMARDAEFNEALKKMMVTLLVTSKLVDFMRTWYDEGFQGLASKCVDFLTVEVPAVATTAAFVQVFVYLTMDSPVLSAVLQELLATAGASGVAMMVFMIGRDVTYMTTDYFILDENRQTLIKSLYPMPAEKTNPWDFWSWLADQRKIDVEKDFRPIYDFLSGPETSFSTAVDDIERYAQQLITIYRHWVLENYEYVRRLDYFKNDPKVWAAISMELSRTILFTRHAVELEEKQQEEAMKLKGLEDDFFAQPPIELETQYRGLITKITINDTPVPLYLKDFQGQSSYTYRMPEPLKLKAGEEIRVSLEYLVFSLPGEKNKISIEPFYHEGHGVYVEEERGARGGIPYEGEVETDEEYGFAAGIATFSLPLKYPSKKDQTGIFFDSVIGFNMKIENEPVFTTTLENPMRVEGPGTDFKEFKQPQYLAWAYSIPESGVHLDRGLFDVVTKEEYEELRGQTSWDQVVIADSPNAEAIRSQACTMAKAMAEPEPVGTWGGGPGCIIKFGGEICYPILDCEFDVCENLKKKKEKEKEIGDIQDETTKLEEAVKVEPRAAVDTNKRLKEQRKLLEEAVDISSHRDQPVQTVVKRSDEFQVGAAGPQSGTQPKSTVGRSKSLEKHKKTAFRSTPEAEDSSKPFEEQRKLWAGAVDTSSHRDKPMQLEGAVKLEPRAAVDIDKKSREQTPLLYGAIDIGSHKDQEIKSAITTKKKSANTIDDRQDLHPWNSFQQEKDIYEELKKELSERQLVDESWCRGQEEQFNQVLNQATDWRSLSLAGSILKEANRCPFWFSGIERLEEKARQIRRHLAEKNRRLKEKIDRQQWINQRLQRCNNMFIDAIRSFRAGNPNAAESLLMKAAQAECPISSSYYNEIRSWRTHYIRERYRSQPKPKLNEGDTLLGQDPSPYFKGPYFGR